LSGRGLCDELITRPEESYRLWCAVVCDLETSCTRRSWPTGGCRAKYKQTNKHRHSIERVHGRGGWCHSPAHCREIGTANTNCHKGPF